MSFIHNGWTCRMWVETVNGWMTSDMRVFRTEEEANAHGQDFVNNITGRELQREYEVYKHYDFE